MLASPKALWDNSLLLIKDSVTEQQYNTWFKPIVFESYKPSTKTLLVQVPSPFVYEYLEQNFVDLLSKVLHRNFGEGIRLTYRVVTDKEHKLSQDIEADPDDADMAKQTRERAQQTAAQPVASQQQEDIDTQLDPKLTFNNYMEGDSNKLPRSVGLSIAEHPNTTQFNPMFIYGPSGSGKTHLVNAIGLKAKQMYPQKRVLYVSARLFQTQYTDAVLHNASNDFINFYQSIDMLIVDDIQEWAGKAKTLNTFFHIFNHLFRNGKRIILASDRPPVELKDMPDRLLTRFSCGLVCELEKPNIQLCVDILSNKIRRDGLKIPVDVISFIAQTCNGSVRDLQGAINGLLAYSSKMSGAELKETVKNFVEGYEGGFIPFNRGSLPVLSGISVEVKETDDGYTLSKVTKAGKKVQDNDVFTVTCLAIPKHMKAYPADADVVFEGEDTTVKDTWTGYVSGGDAVLAEPEDYITLR